MSLSRRALLAGTSAFAAALSVSRRAGAARPAITVYKDPT